GERGGGRRAAGGSGVCGRYGRAASSRACSRVSGGRDWRLDTQPPRPKVVLEDAPGAWVTSASEGGTSSRKRDGALTCELPYSVRRKAYTRYRHFMARVMPT